MPARNYALDLARGLAVALMIVVNNPGDWKEMFAVLRHAEWHGFLGADIVFPLFLFVSGFTAALKISRTEPVGPHCASALTLSGHEAPRYYAPLIRRAVMLFAIGLFLNAWPLGLLPGTEFAFEKLRLFGVLQRIALCAFVGGLLLYWFKTWQGIAGVIVLLALVYEAGMRLGAGAANFELENNFAQSVDTALIPREMLYKVKGIPFDPEGLFTTLTATATFLMGAIAHRIKDRRWVMALLTGVAAVGLAAIEPINKNLWTLPFVFLTASIGVFLVAGLERMGRPEKVFGRFTDFFANLGKRALLVYALSVLVARTLALWKWAPGLSVKQRLYMGLTAMPMPAKFLSLSYSLILLAGLVIVSELLQRKNPR